MESHFSSEFFAGNRAKLRQLFTGTAPIVITANGLLQRGGDTTFSFAQDANFWYLTGIDEPDIILVMDKGSEFLIVPGRSANRETFDGAVDNSDLVKISGIKTIYNDKEGWDKLKARLRKVKHVATLASPPVYIESYGFYANPARLALSNKIKTYNHEIKLLDLNHHLIRLRMIKQPEELKAINSAIDITVSAIKHSTRRARLAKYAYEYELEAELTKIMRIKGASGHAFAPIVASGERACTLHNVSNNGKFSPKDLVIIDTGAEVEHYAADITRTISLSAKPSKRQRAVYDSVKEVQDYALGLLKPGIMMKDYEQQVVHFMGEKLRSLGLIKSIDHAKVRQYYPHATSHFVGLNVHDAGDYDLPLEAGVVITVEPGIYIQEEAIGIRLEDDVLVTDKGIKVLTKKLPLKLT